VIKASALLVALAIGLLVAGVVASSLLMVYVSIGVCAVAALLLTVGVLSHWSEIFGQREARPVMERTWSEPQVNVTAPVLASIQAVAVARASSRPGREEARVREAGARPDGGRLDRGRLSGERPDGTRAPERPAEVAPSPAEVAGQGDEFPAARRSDDLWERVEEELGSAAKRDTGALSWPGTAIPPVPPDVPGAAESAAPTPEAEPQGEAPGERRAGAGAWLWGSGAGSKPPETADPAWPPPAAAFAEPQAAAEPAEPEPATPEPAATEAAAQEPVVQEPVVQETAAQQPAVPLPGGPGDTAGTPVPDETAPEPAADADIAEDAGVREAAGAGEAAGAAPDHDAVLDDGVVADDEAAPDTEVAPDAEDHETADRQAAEPAEESTSGEPAGDGGQPDWIIGASRPAGQEPAAEIPPAQSPAVQEPVPEEPVPEEPVPEEPVPEEPVPERAAVKEPTAEPSGAEDPAAATTGADDPAAGEPGAGEPAVEEPAVGEPAAGEPAVREPAPGSPGPAAEDPSGDGGTAKPAPGRVEVTVVPGVARYHRSECILIRFLGADDLDIMTKQEAVDAKFIACRACQPDQLGD
jgi:hypothetical protein